MRNVVLGLGISLDGYIARPDGSYDFLFIPSDYGKKSMGKFMASIDAALMGRKTYDVGVKAGGAAQFAKMDSYVFSRTLASGKRDGVTFTQDSPAEVVRQIRRRRGKKIWLMGGGELALDFLKADLVDELYIGIVPVLIGDGIPLFLKGFPQRSFKLVENKTFSRGLVSLKYQRDRSKKKSKR
ncbi:MAG TPA: dihydrofolate reductase family protein [Candidatus Angelobacter sp.]|nr:dihydrofolate reductase family protein [Candidatus Angelobacter sp.]